jgi:hypothetical protein
MKKLKKALRRKHRALAWRQAVRARLRGVEKWYRNRKRIKSAKWVDRAQNRLTRKIKTIQGDIRDLNKRIDRLEEQQRSNRQRFVAWLHTKVGVTEYSSEHVKWANDLGYSASLPWCSIFVGYGLKHPGGFAGDLPPNPAYSGNWLTWAHGDRVSYSNAIPGDLLIFDWSDGGITDHVAVFIGDGLKIGGNENNRVEKDAVPVGNIVGVVRPNW